MKIPARRFHVFIIAGFALGNLVAMGLAAYFLHLSKVQYEQRAHVQTQNIALAIDQAVSAAIERIDQTLSTAADELEHELESGAASVVRMSGYLKRHAQRLPNVDVIYVTDADGAVIIDHGGDRDRDSSLAARDFFRTLRAQPGRGLLMSDPVMGRAFKKRLLVFSRRYNKPDGSFAGIITAPVALDSLDAMFARFDIGRDGMIMLRRNDGSLMTRYPPAPTDAPGNAVISNHLKQILASGMAAATFHTAAEADDIERVTSIRRLGVAPIVVSVGVTQQSYLGAWHAQAWQTALLLAGFTLFSVTSTVLLLNMLNRIIGESIRNQLYLQRASDGIHVLDADGTLIEANDKFCAMLGYRRDEMIGMNVTEWDARWSPETLLKEIIPAHLKLDNATTFETLHRRRNGEIFDVWVSAAGVTLEGKRLVFASSRDISERKRSEEGLRQAAAIFHSSREGIMLTDLAGIIQTVNPAFSAITGYSAQEARGRTNSFRKSAHHDREFYAAFWRELLQAGHWRGEIWNRRKGGEVYPEWLTISTVYDEHGQPTNYVGIFSDITQVKESEARLQHLAHHDVLTGLPNRLLLLSRIEHAVARSLRNGSSGAVLFIDLDHFKHVNDSLGHPAGDEVLCIAAQRLKSRLRSLDTLARLGGDEFIVLLEDIESSDDAADIANMLIEALRPPCHLSCGQTVYLGCSIGISMYPDDSDDHHQIIQFADTALYHAKDEGRGTFHFYSQSLGLRANSRLALESALRQALAGNEFVLHYQPIVDLRSERVVGVEALLRWQPPGAGLMFPRQFIELAEETGLIVEIGSWALRHACAQAHAWRSAGINLDTLAVNLSPRQLRAPGLSTELAAILAEYPLPDGLIELEITESAIMQQGAQTHARLLALKGLGVRLTVDDFGAGYSSLAYLKRFPIDKLKIAKGFVREISAANGDMEIVTACIAVGQNLKLQVAAQGIDNAAQRNFLTAHDCVCGQGALFSEALPAAQLESWLAARTGA